MIRFVGLSLVAAALVVFGGLVITSLTGATVAKGAAVYSGGTNLLAGWLSFVPVAVVRRRRRDYLPHAVLAATTIRLLLVALATFVAMSKGWYGMWALAVWVIAFYLGMLVVETGFAVRLVKESHAAGCGS